MGRTVVAEESVEEYILSLYGVRKWQIGLVIGQVSSQRDYVVYFARTPEQAESAGQNGDTAAKVQSVEEVDDNWVVEHAHQVSRMLIGGVDVIGIFAFGPPDMLNKMQSKLRHLIFAIQKAVFGKPAVYFDAADQSRIIVQICSQTKKITCRTMDASDPKSTVSPAEFKFQSFISRWHKLEASVKLNVQINIPQKIERASLQTQITSGLHSTLQRIGVSLCTVNGQFRPDDQLLVPQSGEKRQGKSSHGVSKSVPVRHKVDVYVQQGNSNLKTTRTASVASLSLCGAIHCRACVNQKATVKQAIQAVKYDIVRSILSRCEVLCEDILDSQEGRDDEGSSTWTLPKRVFASLNDTPLSVCDYMFKDEDTQDSVDRMSELLDVSPKQSDLESLETFPDKNTVQSIVEQLESEMKMEHMRTGLQDPCEDEQRSGYRKTLVGAVVGVLTALVAAGISLVWGE